MLNEHQDNHFIKEQSKVEKYLLRIIQRYFDIENNFTTNVKINLELLKDEGKIIERDLAGMKFYRI
jgi:hypothetical protein